MTVRTRTMGALARTLLALAGLVAGGMLGAWELATACFAGLSALAVLQGAAAERRERRSLHQARRDPLTGLGNYRSLHEGLREVTAGEAERFALLTLDVDSFKAINDAHGHLEGDRLLQEVGRVLEENVRANDVVARQGGDEFSVLLPETDEAGAAMLAHRIEEALATIAAAGQTPVRASIGMAVFPQDGATADELLEKADRDLRTTKQARRVEARPATV
jgi:diguanylate cyclase (GGDEF)-like protein